MSPVDAVMPLLQTPWTGRHGEQLPVVPLPAIRQEAVTNLEAYWPGILTQEMREVLRRTCGLSGTPLGTIDFTGRWFPEEPLSIFRPSITLAIDDQGRRWIAELGKGRGLPGPVWCIFSRPEVALLIDRNLADFLRRLHTNVRCESLSEWLTTLSVRARKLWASRHGRAMSVPVAFNRLKEIRGWLAGLPANAWIYDLRAPGGTRGLPYGLIHERGQCCRCGRLLVFAFTGSSGPAASVVDEMTSMHFTEGSSWSPHIGELAGRAEWPVYNFVRPTHAGQHRL
ncbi:MAG TPA: hypothetical protein VI653_09965 [Steroidobacteraceae bacterium]